MSKNALSVFLLVLLALIWGSSFILMKRGMETVDGIPIFSDSQVASLRMLIAGLVLLPFSIYFFRKIKTVKHFIFLTIVGVCGNFLPAFLFTYAETELSSGYAGMLNSFTPIFSLIVGGLIFRQQLRSNQLIGVIVAFVGIVLLMLAGQDLSQSGSWNHILAIVCATLFYAISLNTIKHTLSGFSSIEITSLAFGILFIPSLLATYGTQTVEVFKHNPHVWEGFGYICMLSLVGTAFALIVFNRLIALSSTVFASSVTYLIPIVAVLIGFAYNEKINIYQIASMCLVISGVFVANYSKKSEL